MSIVRDFSNALLDPLGAPRGKWATVDTFTEIDIKLASGAKVRPDGLIRVTYGQTEWVALVEVETGDAPLRAEQVHVRQ